MTPSGYADMARGGGTARPAPIGSVIEMRVWLGQRRPASASEALQMLRTAYPAAPLALRVEASGAFGG